MSVWGSRYLQLNLNNEIKCQFFQGTSVLKTGRELFFKASQNLYSIFAKWAFANVSTEHTHWNLQETMLQTSLRFFKWQNVCVKQNISSKDTFSPRRACSSLALLWNPAGWWSLWYNDSAVILSIRVGGKGDGMDIRLINSLTHLRRKGILYELLPYLPSKK